MKECDEYYCYYDEYFCDRYDEESCYNYSEEEEECGELICDFVACEPDEHKYGEGTCWKELCYDECSNEECVLWHAIS